MVLRGGRVKILSFTPTAVDSSHFNCVCCLANKSSYAITIRRRVLRQCGRILSKLTDEMPLTANIVTNASAMQPGGVYH